MPTLEILDPKGKLHDLSSLQLLAYAAYSDDPEARAEYVEAFLWEDLLLDLEEKESQGEEATIPIGPEELDLLLSTPPPRFTYLQGGAALHRGMVAGAMTLMSIWARTVPLKRRPSKQKIIDALREAWKTGDSDDDSLPKNRVIWTRMREFKKVSHIHAAFGPTSGASGPWPSSVEDYIDTVCRNVQSELIETLTIAESLRLKMESLDLAKPGELYSAPASLELEVCEIDFGPFPEELTYCLL